MRKGTNVPRREWGRHRRLLENPDVKRWYDNLARGSPVTADVRLRRLGVYCETAGTTPEEFAGAGAADVRAVDNMLMDHVSLLEGRGYAPSYIDDILKCLRSWLSFNYVKSVRRIRIKNADIPVTLQDEVVPSKAKLGELLDAAPARERVSISLMAFSGVRPEVLGDYYGRDGLKVSDIEGMEAGGGDVTFAQMPARVTVRAELSKAGNRYFTFLPETGCRYLRGYLRDRMANGEPVGADSPVITFRPGYRTKSARDACHLRTVSITAAIKAAFGVIIKGRPYVLRSYFDTQLLLAESQGRMTHAYRQFFMGHKGDIEARYTTNKHRLADTVIQDMREAYVRSQAMLSPFEREEEKRDRRETLLEMWRDQAKMYGIDPMKIRIERQRVQKGDVGSPDPADLEMDAIKEAIRRTVQPAAGRMRMPGPAGADSYESRLVDCEADLLSCVSQGWDVVRELSRGRILLRRGAGTADGVPQHPGQ